MEDLVLLTQEEDLSRPSSVHLLGLVEHSAAQLDALKWIDMKGHVSKWIEMD